MSGTQAVMDVSSLGLLEPRAVPGIEKTLTKVLIIFSVIIGLGLVVTISSIVGVIRAVRRRRRGGHSVAAVVLAAIANAISVLPLSWLIASIHANVARRQE